MKKDMNQKVKRTTVVLLAALLACSMSSLAMAAEDSTVKDTQTKTESTVQEDNKTENDASSKTDADRSEKADSDQNPEKGKGTHGDHSKDQDTEKPEKPDGDPGDSEGGQGAPGDSEGGQGGPGGSQGGPGGPGGGGSKPESYESVNEYSEDTEISGETISSTGSDENAILVSGGNVTLKDIVVDRTSADSTGGDSSSFYGVGAAILATDGTAYIEDATITTDAAGGAGAFAYGDGTVYIADTQISTTQGTSGGIHAAGGGTVIAYDVTAETNGGSSAAIRSDRGGGTMIVDGGSFTSNGTGSPAIYSTADIAVRGAELAATNSEAICIEGKNNIYLYDSNLSGNMPSYDQNDCDWNIILYQSMSGDSEVGNSTFQMVGGTLSAENGGMFYTTNTQSTFILSGVDITYSDDSEFLLKATGNANQRGWGQSGANGAQCSFTAIGQDLEGTILWDSISTLDLYMTDGSTWTGSFVNDETNAGEGGDGYASLYLSEDSTWTVTADSTLTNLYAAGTITDEDGKTVSIIGADGTEYVKGDSVYTITVETYEEEADLSGASTITDWSEFEVERPAELG